MNHPESYANNPSYPVATLTPAAISAVNTCEQALKEITGKDIILIAYQDHEIGSL